MEELKLLEAVERYILGQMSADERVYFEQLRKSNPEVDQAVVEHTFFLQQMNRFDGVRTLKHNLNDTHLHLAEKGLIASPRLKGKARIVYLVNRYKRTAALAASIAGITALAISALVWSFSPSKPISDVKNDMAELKRKLAAVDNDNQKLNQKIDHVQNQQNSVAVPQPIQYTTGGSGFLIDVKGLIVTNYHVIENAHNIAVQTSEGNEMSAEPVYTDPERDIAILRINSKEFKAPGSLPYSIRKSSATLSEHVFTLGYPRNEIVYGEGYVAARTGYQGDSLALQLTIAANEGNSGGPVVNARGEVIGILRGKQRNAEGAVFALHSKYIYDALASLQKKDSSFLSSRLPAVSLLKDKEREQQVNRITQYVYMVKVN